MDVTAVAVTSVESGTRADERYRPGAWTRCTGLARARLWKGKRACMSGCRACSWIHHGLPVNMRARTRCCTGCTRTAGETEWSPLGEVCNPVSV